MTKALISVTGLDSTGIIAKVATKLSEMNINILDISQTILDGYFTMMMVVDLDGAGMEFAAIDEALEPIRKEKKIGPNDPCHCGSGLKYKKCCMQKDKAAGLDG